MTTGLTGVSLPENWQWSQLRHLTTNLRRGTSPDYVDDSPVKVINQACVQPAGLDWSRVKFHGYQGDPRSLKGYLQPNDVLVNSTGTGTLGRVGYFQPEGDSGHCISDSHVTVIRADYTQYEPRYAYYYLLCSQFQHYMMSALVAGSTNQIELNPDRLGGAPAPVPPLKEQRRIADFLDAETSRIDRLFGLRSRQISLVPEREQSYLDELLTGDDEKYVALSRMCRVQGGVTVDASRSVDSSVVYPYLRVANVQADRVDIDDLKTIEVDPEDASRSILRAGDVLMTEGGDLDKLGRGTVWRGEVNPCLHQNHVFAIRPTGSLLGEYLALLTRTSHARSYFERTGTKTTNLASTSSGKILSFRVPLPPVERQGSLILDANDFLRQSRQLERQLNRQLDLLAERKQALITAAVTGQIDVTTAGRATSDLRL